MCNICLRDRKSSAEFRNCLGAVNIVDVLHQTRLRWFGDIKTMNIENPVINFRFTEVDGEGEVDHAKHGTSLSKTI